LLSLILQGGSPSQQHSYEEDGLRSPGRGHDRYSFAKNKGGYSMSGRRTENVADKMATGTKIKKD